MPPILSPFSAWPAPGCCGGPYSRAGVIAAFASGLLFGVAFLMKQQGVFLLGFGGAMALLYCRGCRRLAWRKAVAFCWLYALGSVLPYAAVCLWLWHAGVFGKFWFWTVEYASKYLEQIPLNLAAEVLWMNVHEATALYWPLLLLALAGVVAAVLWRKEKIGRQWFVLAYLLFSFLCVCPGLLFRQHYFLAVLPALALLAGVGAAG